MADEDVTKPPHETWQRPRDSKGHWIRTTESVQRDAEAARLYQQMDPRLTLDDIARQLGYTHRADVWWAIRRARADIVLKTAGKLTALEEAELDELYAQTLRIIERDHLTVSHGKIIKDDDGNPLLDDGPKLAALREARAIRESFRKLKGLDAPSRVSVDAEKLGDEIKSLLNAALPADNTDDSAGTES